VRARIPAFALAQLTLTGWLVTCPLTSTYGETDTDAAVDQHAESTIDAEQRRLFALIDPDGDQQVPLLRMAQALGLDNSENISPRQFAMLGRYDENDDGLVSLGEFCAGQRYLFERQLRRAMATDIDGNGKLTMQEYVLGVPDARAKRAENGYTKRQVKFFKSFDADEDGFVSEQEFHDSFVNTYRKSFEAGVLAGRAMKLDRDGDERLDLQEFAFLYSPQGEITDAVEDVFKKKFLKRDGKIDFWSFRGFLFEAEPSRVAEIRRLIEAVQSRQPIASAE